MPRPVHFEIFAADLDRAQQFYEAVFDWTITPRGPDYRLIATGEDGPGINGALLPRHGPGGGDTAPVIAWVCTVQVDDLADYLSKALAAGGTQALPRMDIPGVGAVAYAKDTEGNIFGMLQPS
ncbi:MAG TPA: VOC family protein [Phenylobacterium sp.]